MSGVKIGYVNGPVMLGCKLFCSRWEKCRNSPRTGGVKQQVIMVSPPGQQALRMRLLVYQTFLTPELAAVD